MGLVRACSPRRFGSLTVTDRQAQKRSTAARVAAVLRERIGSGELSPGSRIIELDVAGELGVSRSPVREALLKLSEEGLVTILPYRGALVVPLRRERLLELLEFRLALEHFALERLVQRADAAAIAELRVHLAAMRKALGDGDRLRAVDEDLAMHRTLISLAGNALVERAYESLLAQVRLYIDLTSATYERADDLAGEHEMLLDAIERREFLMSRKLLDAHIMHGFDELRFDEA